MQKYIKIVFYLLLIFYFISLFFREINGDEGIISEHSYWLAKSGYVKSVMFTGLGLGWETRQYHYHKLFVILGAISISLFQVSLIALRSISLISSLLFFILFYFYLKKFKKLDSSKLLLIVLILFFIQSHFFIYSFLFRPEIMLMLIIFLSFYFIEIGNSKQNIIYIILSGIFAGLAFFTHLNGIIAVFAGLTILIYQRNYFYSTIFIITSILFSLLYFFDISNLNDFQQFLFQFKNDPNFSTEHFEWYSPFVRLIDEHKRFFHSLKEISLSFLFMFSLYMNFNKLWNKNKSLLIYISSLIFFLAIFTHGKTDKYLILFLPYIIYIISITLKDAINFSIKKRIILYALSMFFLVTNLITNINSLSFIDTIKRNREIAENMVLHSNVLTRETFFFNEINNFTLHIPMAYELKTKRNGLNQSRESFFNFAKNNYDKYIALENNKINQSLLKLIEWDSLVENQVIFNYRVIKKNEAYIIFENISIK